MVKHDLDNVQMQNLVFGQLCSLTIVMQTKERENIFLIVFWYYTDIYVQI